MHNNKKLIERMERLREGSNKHVNPGVKVTEKSVTLGGDELVSGPNGETLYGVWSDRTHFEDKLPQGGYGSSPANLIKGAARLLGQVENCPDAPPEALKVAQELIAATKAYVEAYQQFHALDEKFRTLAMKSRDL